MTRIGFVSCLAFLALSVLGSSRTAADEAVIRGVISGDAGPNFYRVVFPDSLEGQEVEMEIVGGAFSLAIDEVAGTARITEWTQDVSEISLFGASTGPITVTLDATRPSEGTFVKDTFHVSAGFILSFDDSQLGQYGFTSPFYMSATEEGAIFGLGSVGTIGMHTSGTGGFGQAGQFTYTCLTSAFLENTLPPGKGQPGDVNADRRFDLSDPVSALDQLFLGVTVPCPGAIDVNGDGKRDVTDAIFMLQYLFQGGRAPATTPIDCGS